MNEHNGYPFAPLLNDDAALAQFIADCESDLQHPSRDLSAGILRHVAETRRCEERESLFRRRVLAAACLSGAACVMLMAVLGVFQDVASWIALPADQLMRFLEGLR